MTLFLVAAGAERVEVLKVKYTIYMNALVEETQYCYKKGRKEDGDVMTRGETQVYSNINIRG